MTIKGETIGKYRRRAMSAPEGKEFGLFCSLLLFHEPIDYLAHNRGSIKYFMDKGLES